jgi:hypothetical protein
MRIRNPTDLGAFIRDRRSQLGLDQAELAEKAGTSRKWLIEVEQRKVYQLGCSHCCHVYGANGSDTHLRKMPELPEWCARLKSRSWPLSDP